MIELDPDIPLVLYTQMMHGANLSFLEVALIDAFTDTDLIAYCNTQCEPLCPS